jgi:hypothetical protein
MALHTWSAQLKIKMAAMAPGSSISAEIAFRTDIAKAA